MKRLFAFLVALSLTASTPDPALANPYDYDGSAIVRITCNGKVGTATHLGLGLYSTATHVISGCESSLDDVRTKGDFSTYRGPIISASISYTCKKIKKREEYLAIGYAGGDYSAWVLPWTASRFREGGFRTFYGEAIPGMSGGPIINKEGNAAATVNMRWPSRGIPYTETYLCKD